MIVPAKVPGEGSSCGKQTKSWFEKVAISSLFVPFWLLYQSRSGCLEEPLVTPVVNRGNSPALLMCGLTITGSMFDASRKISTHKLYVYSYMLYVCKIKQGIKF